MPYLIRKKGNKWLVINEETGQIKGTHNSKKKAKAQMRLLYGIEHGWRPTRRKDKFWRAVASKRK